MPDEASTHYAAVVDQLIEGHQWLFENLGIGVENAWINDPFGYSSTMPYLWKKSGIQHMVILRMHQAIKATLMRKHMMDFKWRPYWNPIDDVNDILCNIMPYPGYWNSDVCGPDQTVCKKFNFLHMRSSVDSEPVTENNIDDLAQKLYKAYKFTSSLYRYKTLIIFIGEDNSYDEQTAFKDTNINYGKLMNYINNKKDWKMKIRFGTIADYFRNIKSVEKGSTPGSASLKPFPLLSGDFFPYSDFTNDTWTGYYTTRMWMKRFLREVEPVQRMADVNSVFAYIHCIRGGKCADISGSLKQVLTDLREARRDIGMFQHHDGITGTSLPFVVTDYEERLKNAFEKSKIALKRAIILILSNGKIQDVSALEDNLVKDSARSILSQRMFRVKDNMQIIVANPLERTREDTVSFYIDRTDIRIFENDGSALPFQILTQTENKQSVTVKVKLEPYEMKTLFIKIVTDTGKETSVKTENNLAHGDETKPLRINNKYLTIEVDPKTGSLLNIIDDSDRLTTVKSEFLKYIPSRSGAYLFEPAGPAVPILELRNEAPKITVEKGPLFSQIHVSRSIGFSQKFILYNLDGVKGKGLHITNEVTLNLAASLTNSEVIMRFYTDVENQNIFFTDQNGFQLIGRRNNPERPIETNYYPITSMAVLEDKNKRLTLHSAQSHGVASLKNGWLEVMIDRNVNRDDKKGLGMGANERVLTLTEFVLEVQHKVVPAELPEERFTYPTVDSIVQNELLQSKTQVFAVIKNEEHFDKLFKPLVPPFPCDLAVVGMRFIPTAATVPDNISLVLHRKPVHCSYQLSDNSCSIRDTPFAANSLMNMFNVSSAAVSENIKETSLTHLNDVAKINSDTDLRPTPSELRSYLIHLSRKPPV